MFQEFDGNILYFFKKTLTTEVSFASDVIYCTCPCLYINMGSSWNTTVEDLRPSVAETQTHKNVWNMQVSLSSSIFHVFFFFFLGKLNKIKHTIFYQGIGIALSSWLSRENPCWLSTCFMGRCCRTIYNKISEISSSSMNVKASSNSGNFLILSSETTFHFGGCVWCSFGCLGNWIIHGILFVQS